ncbi:MAG TPA: acyltransferase, partial [Novosphingobium sp.]
MELTSRPVEGRRDQLDSLRLIAILGVLFDHAGVSTRFFPGEVGVRFFLLLSGFLITGTLVRQAGGGWRECLPALKDFYARRALRIWPLYYAVLAGLLLTGEILWREALIHGLFLTNFVQAVENQWQIPSWFLPHLWTLCVQEQYYLVWPLLFVVLHGPGRSIVLAAMLALAVAFRLGMWLAGLHLQVAFFTLPFASFDALAVGSLLAIGHRRLRADLTPRLTLAATILAVVLGLAGMLGGFVSAVALPLLWLLPLSVL